MLEAGVVLMYAIWVMLSIIFAVIFVPCVILCCIVCPPLAILLFLILSCMR